MNAHDLLAKIAFDNVELDAGVEPLAMPLSLGRRNVERGEYECESVRPVRAALFGASKSVRAAKPDEVCKLEQLLSAEYDVPVLITRVQDVPTTRKQVKEVCFLKERKLSKVWVFKADPASTAKELITYHIVYGLGIPTGRPIGYIPTSAQEQYPFDVAVVGGILEHAGNPYTKLIDDLALEPRYVFDTALVIANMIAEYQVKLTRAKKEFEDRGIVLEHSSPTKELRDRLLAALRISEEKARPVMDACEQLAQKQSDTYVVSHGDIHTGNIVTISDEPNSTTLDRFGVIDWGSIVLDNPYGDVRDFWAHHARQAEKCCEDYQFTFEEVDRAYRTRVRQMVERDGAAWLWPDERVTKVDSLIQSVLWNVYEMYDPVRKDPKEIQEKARRHYGLLREDLNVLKNYGFRKEAMLVKKELSVLLKDEKYLWH